MRRQFPGVPIIGLTATAGSSVVTDVKKILGISDCLLFRASFNRTNLFYEVRSKTLPTDLIVARILLVRFFHGHLYKLQL